MMGEASSPTCMMRQLGEIRTSRIFEIDIVHTLLMETERKVNVRLWSRSSKLMVLQCRCLWFFFFARWHCNSLILSDWSNLSLVDLTLPCIHLSHKLRLSMEWVTLKIGMKSLYIFIRNGSWTYYAVGHLDCCSAQASIEDPHGPPLQAY